MECRLQSNEKMLENDKIKLKHLETFYNEINNKVEDLKLEYKEFQTNFNSKIEEKINEINLNNSTSLKTSLEEQCEYGLKFQGRSYSKNLLNSGNYKINRKNVEVENKAINNFITSYE